MHAHGPLDAAGQADTQLIALVTVEASETDDEFGAGRDGQSLLQLPGSVCGIADKQPFRAKIGNLARPSLAGAQIDLGGKLDGLAGTASTFS